MRVMGRCVFVCGRKTAVCSLEEKMRGRMLMCNMEKVRTKCMLAKNEELWHVPGLSLVFQLRLVYLEHTLCLHLCFIYF